MQFCTFLLKIHPIATTWWFPRHSTRERYREKDRERTSSEGGTWGWFLQTRGSSGLLVCMWQTSANVAWECTPREYLPELLRHTQSVSGSTTSRPWPYCRTVQNFERTCQFWYRQGEAWGALSRRARGLSNIFLASRLIYFWGWPVLYNRKNLEKTIPFV